MSGQEGLQLLASCKAGPDWEVGGKAGFMGGEAEVTSSFELVNLRCLGDFQTEILRKQWDLEDEFRGEVSLEIHIWKL